MQEAAGKCRSLRPDECEHVVPFREEPTRRLRPREVRVRVVDMPFAVVADRRSQITPASRWCHVVPRRQPTCSEKATTAGSNDLRGYRGNEFLAPRTARCTAPVVDEGTTSGKKMHGARYTSGTEFYLATGDIYATQQLLGHADVSTTANIYVQRSPADLEEKLRKVWGE